MTVFMACATDTAAARRGLVAGLVLMAAISNIVPFALIAWGEEHIDSGIASVLNSTLPIFTAVSGGGVPAGGAIHAANVGPEWRSALWE